MLQRLGCSWGFGALPFTPPTYNSCWPETRTHSLWVASPTPPPHFTAVSTMHINIFIARILQMQDHLLWFRLGVNFKMSTNQRAINSCLIKLTDAKSSQVPWSFNAYEILSVSTRVLRFPLDGSVDVSEMSDDEPLRSHQNYPSTVFKYLRCSSV